MVPVDRGKFVLFLFPWQEHWEEEASTQPVRCAPSQDTSSCQTGPSYFYLGFSLLYKSSLQPSPIILHVGLIEKNQIQIIKVEILFYVI